MEFIPIVSGQIEAIGSEGSIMATLMTDSFLGGKRTEIASNNSLAGTIALAHVWAISPDEDECVDAVLLS